MELRSGRKISLCSANLSSPKRARVGDIIPASDLFYLLPSELLEMIFKSLDNKTLLRIRLTCHRWKEIVDRKRNLQNRFGIIFPKGLVMNRWYKPENMFPAIFALLEKIRIIRVGLWWPSFGERLTEIFFWHCVISLRTFLEMLRYTPNLETLDLRDTFYTPTQEPATMDYELHKFHSLDLGPAERVFDVYSKIFSSLTKLAVCGQLNLVRQQKACQLIRSVQTTLKQVKIQFAPFVLQQMGSMNQLRLRTVYLSGGNNDAVLLSQIQPSIEQLFTFDYELTNTQLCEIGRNLPNLKEIRITVVQDGSRVGSFLAHMVQLTSLEIKATGSPLLNLHGSKTPNLRTLCIKTFAFAENNLLSYLKDCGKLRILRLESCTVQSWSEIFSLELPSSLRLLHLKHMNVLEDRFHFPPRTYNFENLAIDLCNVSPEWLIQLVELSPRIEFLFVGEVSVDDGTVLELCRRARWLKTLCLHNCTITDVCVEHMIEHCSELGWLRVFPKETLSLVAYERLKRLKNAMVSHC